MAKSSSPFSVLSSLSPVVGLLFIGAIAYSVFWLYMAESAEDMIKTLSADMEKEGVYFSYDDLEVTGFPYRLAFDFSNSQLVIKDQDLRLTWQADKLEAVVQPWKMKHVILLMPNSDMQLRHKDDIWAEIKSTNGQASVRYEGDRLRQISVAFNAPKLAVNDQPALEVASLGLHLRIPTDEELAAQKSNLNEPKLADLAMIVKGMPISPAPKVSGIPKPGAKTPVAPLMNIEGYLTLRGDSMPRLHQKSLTAWRENSGTIGINGIMIEEDDQRITGDGSFALDDTFRPEGALSLGGKSMAPVLNLLHRFQWISEDEKSLLLKTLPTFKNEQGLQQFAIMVLNGSVDIANQTIGHVEPIIE